MVKQSKRWKDQDPSWYQIVWLYLGALIVFAVPNSTPLRLAVGVGITALVTSLMVVKVVRARNRHSDTHAS
jgi:phosphate starvation-inducible membrane PsiE